MTNRFELATFQMCEGSKPEGRDGVSGLGSREPGPTQPKAKTNAPTY